MWRPRLAWAMFGLTVVCVVAQTLVLADQRSLLSRRTFENGWPIIGVAGVIGALFGALIVSRYPTHRIGWLLVVGQLLTSVGMVADAFAGHILTGHGWGSRSLGHWIEWFSAYVNATPALAFVAAIFLLAPDGYLLSPRWRPAFWLVVLALVLNTAGVLVTDPQSLRYSGEQRFSTTATILLNTAVFCVAGAGAVAPLSRSLPTTPTISIHDILEVRRTRLPIAFAGSPQYSRARFSLSNATGAAVSTSDHVKSRPAISVLPIVAK